MTPEPFDQVRRHGHRCGPGEPRTLVAPPARDLPAVEVRGWIGVRRVDDGHPPTLAAERRPERLSTHRGVEEPVHVVRARAQLRPAEPAMPGRWKAGEDGRPHGAHEEPDRVRNVSGETAGEKRLDVREVPRCDEVEHGCRIRRIEAHDHDGGRVHRRKIPPAVALSQREGSRPARWSPSESRAQLPQQRGVLVTLVDGVEPRLVVRERFDRRDHQVGQLVVVEPSRPHRARQP